MTHGPTAVRTGGNSVVHNAQAWDTSCYCRTPHILQLVLRLQAVLTVSICPSCVFKVFIRFSLHTSSWNKRASLLPEMQIPPLCRHSWHHAATCLHMLGDTCFTNAGQMPVTTGASGRKRRERGDVWQVD